MSIGGTFDKRARRPEAVEFLDQLEDDIRRLGSPEEDSPGTVEDTRGRGAGRGGGKRVSFNSKIHQRRFDKNTAVVEYREDAELSAEESGDEERGTHDGLSLEDHSGDEEEDLDHDEDCSDDPGDDATSMDFASLSPAEQLRMLMEPVTGGAEEDEDEEDEDEDGAAGFDHSGEEDEDDSEEASVDGDEGIQEAAKTDSRLADRRTRLLLDQEENDGKEKRQKSSFERQQEKLGQRIAELEQESLAERPWMLRGEVTAQHRPLNSLLEQDLDFEHALRPAPAITEEVTESIESLIRQRIKDRAWDDVERRIAPQAAPAKRRPPELDGEPSKKSLSEVYEEQHQAAQRQTDPKRDAVPVDKATHKAHEEIGALFKKLCHKIDALSGFKFVPRTYTIEEVTLKPLRKG